VDIAPVDDRRVTRAHIRHDTVRGVAEVEWSRTETKWQFHVTMPSGATATIRVPGAEAVEVGAGRHDLVLKRAPVAA
jgi:alpha-L-rhamnosidase